MELTPDTRDRVSASATQRPGLVRCPCHLSAWKQKDTAVTNETKQRLSEAGLRRNAGLSGGRRPPVWLWTVVPRVLLIKPTAAAWPCLRGLEDRSTRSACDKQSVWLVCV